MPASSPLIVCGTDFSANARRASEVAAAIARRRGGRLALVHYAAEASDPGKSAAEVEAALRPLKLRLHREAKLLGEWGARVHDEVVSGASAAEALIAYATTHAAALVVVSSVSKTRFERWTLGNVSERVAEHSPVPTLVVRSPYALLEWANGERPLKVFVAVGFSLSSDAALAWVGGLVKLGDCAVTVAHVNWPPATRPLVSSKQATMLGRNPPALNRQLERELEKRAKPWPDGTAVTLHVEPNWGRPDAALVSAANAVQADLVVTGTHQWHGLERLNHGSVSRGVLRHTTANVACVPTPAAMAHGVEKTVRLRRILVATDFSANGDQAVAWAYSTLPVGGVVRLLHVVSAIRPPMPSRLGLMKGAARAELHRHVVAARTKLAALIPPGAAARGVRTEIEVVAAPDPAQAIGAEVRRFDPDLICLGTPGHGPWFETLHGSVTKKVMTANARPVLLVPPAPP